MYLKHPLLMWLQD